MCLTSSCFIRHEFDSEQIPDLTKDVYIQDIHCVGSLCKLYFRELPNPLLTYQLYEKFSVSKHYQPSRPQLLFTCRLALTPLRVGCPCARKDCSESQPHKRVSVNVTHPAITNAASRSFANVFLQSNPSVPEEEVNVWLVAVAAVKASVVPVVTGNRMSSQ